MRTANKVISKFTSILLISGCILLSSPATLYAEDIAPTQTEEVSQNEPLEVQQIEPEEASIDEGVVVLDLQNEQVNEENNDEISSTEAINVPLLEEDFVEADSEILTATLSEDADASLVNSDTVLEPETIITTLSEDDQNLAVNSDTGAASDNEAETDINTETDVLNNNYAQVFNDSFLRADTGRNNANYNTGSGIITTSRAEGNGQLANVINTNNLGIVEQEQDALAGNQYTGSGSDNQSQVNINNQLTVKNVNYANVINRLTADINSGNNNANYNTGHGMVATGSANLGLSFFSIANTNVVGTQKFYANSQNIYNSFTGNVDLSGELAFGASPLSGHLTEAFNNSTGAGSDNQSVVNINDETSITNQNRGNINNQINADVVSGRNKANYNTGAGSVASGEVNSAVSVVNFLNSNITSGNALIKTLNVFGDWRGDLRLPSMPTPQLTVTTPSVVAGNSNTGFGSDNLVGATVDGSTSITNNNLAVIENNVNFSTDAGNNSASYNGGSGIVQVGSARGETNEMNVANLNVTGNSWWLVVVNRFGNWNGTAVGAPSSVLINSTGVSTVLTPVQSGIQVGNNSTGPNSDNEAGASINNRTDINNGNEANIINNLNINAISGQNEVQQNTGHGFITTGDISGVNNIVNFANVNIAVGDWAVIVVNVFGDWDGNLIFNTPGGGIGLPVGGSLACPVFSTSSGDSFNVGTGYGSENSAWTSANTNNNVTNNNNTNLNNNTGVSSTTGQNNANYNTGTGTINTGGASAGSSVGNQANTNTTQVNSDSGGSSESGNAGTGAGSDNNASSQENNNTDITNNNNTTADNNLFGENNTGGNSSNYNTGPATIDTGWAHAFLELLNEVGENEVGIGDLTSALMYASNTPAGQQVIIPGIDPATNTCPGVVIEVTSSNNSFLFGESATFTAVAKGPDGQPIIPQPAFTWAATGGTIDESGNFVAGSATGTFAITATALYGNQGLASITISSPSGGGGGGGGGGGSMTGFNSLRVRGDYNNDGKVDDLDFSILMARWGADRTGFFAQDAGTGKIGDKDFSIVMSNWIKAMLTTFLRNNKTA